ncbi:hypothetical protein [uncultured Umboniibacter sp.]|uniref:hypothetical protein n=1 Tax=uncultured Umboniibacter sp. TaxID=1798917 RepID=UPI002622AA9D|nr:hypothetical protein [uncultured Umboniibacter sp.]
MPKYQRLLVRAQALSLIRDIQCRKATPDARLNLARNLSYYLGRQYENADVNPFRTIEADDKIADLMPHMIESFNQGAGVQL